MPSIHQIISNPEIQVEFAIGAVIATAISTAFGPLSWTAWLATTAGSQTFVFGLNAFAARCLQAVGRRPQQAIPPQEEFQIVHEEGRLLNRHPRAIPPQREPQIAPAAAGQEQPPLRPQAMIPPRKQANIEAINGDITPEEAFQIALLLSAEAVAQPEAQPVAAAQPECELAEIFGEEPLPIPKAFFILVPAAGNIEHKYHAGNLVLAILAQPEPQDPFRT